MGLSDSIYTDSSNGQDHQASFSDCPASVSLLITKDQRRQLQEMGVGEDEIRNMTPAQAHERLGIKLSPAFDVGCFEEDFAELPPAPPKGETPSAAPVEQQPHTANGQISEEPRIEQPIGREPNIDWAKLMEEDWGDEAPHDVGNAGGISNRPCIGDARDTSSGAPAQPQLEASAPPRDIDPELLKLLPTAEDDEAAPPPEWLVQGLIEENTDVALYAPLSFLKSFVALDLCYAVATGINALGTLPVLKQAPVIYFCGEGYQDIRKKRRAAWEIEHGFAPFKVPEIWFAPGVPLVNDQELIDKYVKVIQYRTGGKPIGLFAIDTLNRMLNGQDEDKAHVASRYLNVVSEIRKQVGGTSLTIGHMSHKTDNWDERGSSAFPAGFDTILWIIQHDKDEETGVHTITLRVRKQKSIDDEQRYYLQSKVVVTPNGPSLVLVSCTLEEAKAAIGKKGKITVTADMVHDALKHSTDGRMTTAYLARKILELHQNIGITEETIRKTLNRQRDGRFAKFKHEHGWILPTPAHWEPQAQNFLDDLNAVSTGYATVPVVWTASGENKLRLVAG
jgi:hypothetical protein